MSRNTTTTFDRNTLIAEYQRVRDDTELLCNPLATDDYQIQSIVQTSPPKWHIAHVTWFFESFVLPHFQPGYRPFDPHFDFIFNSYYYTHGQMHPRPQRGLLSRPTLDEVYRYRGYIDEKMLQLMSSVKESQWEELAFRVVLGLNHEEQHQELLLMDIKHNFSANPLKPAYREDLDPTQGNTQPVNWLEQEGGLLSIGHNGEGFTYDNETPRHQTLLQPHRLADRFVTNGEYLAFIEDDGYANPALWLSDGWSLLQRHQKHHPLYWDMREGQWWQFTLGGMRPLIGVPVERIGPGHHPADAVGAKLNRRQRLRRGLSRGRVGLRVRLAA